MYKETFSNSGEWIKVYEPKPKREPRQKPQPIDWERVLKICQTCGEYIKPDSQYPRGHCESAIDDNYGNACEGCFKTYIRKCEKLK